MTILSIANRKDTLTQASKIKGEFRSIYNNAFVYFSVCFLQFFFTWFENMYEISTEGGIWTSITKKTSHSKRTINVQNKIKRKIQEEREKLNKTERDSLKILKVNVIRFSISNIYFVLLFSTIKKRRRKYVINNNQMRVHQFNGIELLVTNMHWELRIFRSFSLVSFHLVACQPIFVWIV